MRKVRNLSTTSILFSIILLCNTGISSERIANIEELTRGAKYILVGKVLEIYSKFDDQTIDKIYTYVVIETNQYIKGVTGDRFFTVRFPGGIVGDFGIWVEHTPQFSIGEEVVVFVARDSYGEFSIYGWRQGKLGIYNDKIIFNEKPISVTNFINAIKTYVKKGETGKIELIYESTINLENKNTRNRTDPFIDHITSTSGPAIRPYAIKPNDPFNPGDRGTILHIYGSGFGAKEGTGVVSFYEDGSAHVDAEDIIYWSDTHINCKIPGRQWIYEQGFRNASSGLMYVTTDEGTSNGKHFTVTFASKMKYFNTLPITYYINENGTPDCSGEFTAVQESFQTWENVSFSNLDYTYGGTTTRMPPVGQRDFYNDCAWIESNWEFSSLAIAINQWWFNGSSISTEIYEFDIFFNGVNYTWSSTEQTGRMDVQNIASYKDNLFLNSI